MPLYRGRTRQGRERVPGSQPDSPSEPQFTKKAELVNPSSPPSNQELSRTYINTTRGKKSPKKWPPIPVNLNDLPAFKPRRKPITGRRLIHAITVGPSQQEE